MQLNSCTFPETYLELDIATSIRTNFSLEKIVEQSTFEINGQEGDDITFMGERRGEEGTFREKLSVL